jgi:hypothetical protein
MVLWASYGPLTIECEDLRYVPSQQRLGTMEMTPASRTVGTK